MNTVQFGEHLTIDGYGGSYALLNDQARVFEVISKLPDLLGMHALSEPMLVSAPDNEIKDPGGWSGFVIIAESHIALHTFPKRGFVSADVYTCQAGLDVDFVCKFFTQQFDLQDIETHFIPRGTRYPVRNIYP